VIKDGWRGDGLLSPALPKIERIDDPCGRIEAENRQRDPSPVLTLGEEPCEHYVNDGEQRSRLKNPNTLARPTAPMNDMMLEAVAIEVAFLAIFNA